MVSEVVAVAAKRWTESRSDSLLPAAGVGLRSMLDKKNRITIGSTLGLAEKVARLPSALVKHSDLHRLFVRSKRAKVVHSNGLIKFTSPR